MDDKKVIINVEIDLDEVNNIVSEALKLEDNAELFTKLAEFAKIKKQIADAVDAIDRVEVDIKGVINAKAKQLYGNDWQAIAGPGYKISRSFTGAKYEHVGEASEEFIVTKLSINSKAVDTYVKEHSDLPTGIAVNSARGESIRITVKDNGND